MAVALEMGGDLAVKLVCVKPEDKETREGGEGGRDCAGELVIGQIHFPQLIQTRKCIVRYLSREMVEGQVEGLQVWQHLDVGQGTREGIVHQAKRPQRRQ